MKKLILSTATLLGLASVGHSAIIFYEGFNYTGGSNLADNGWTPFTVGNGTALSGTVDSGLTFGAVNTLDVTGGAATISVTDGTSTFSQGGFQSADFGGSFTISTGTLWRSFLYRTSDNDTLSGNNKGMDTNIVRYDVPGMATPNPNRDSANATNDNAGSDGFERKFTLNPKNFGGSGVVGHWSHDDGSSSETNSLALNTTYLIVSSYDFGTKANTIWVFDETTGQAVLNARASGSITAATLDSAVGSGFKVTKANTSRSLTLTNQDALVIAHAINAISGAIDLVGTYDEFRISTDLNDAIVVVPEPSTYAALLGFIALAGAIIRRRLKS